MEGWRSQRPQRVIRTRTPNVSEFWNSRPRGTRSGRRGTAHSITLHSPSISPHQIPCINLLCNICQSFILTIRNNHIALAIKLCQISFYTRIKERFFVQSRLVNHNFYSIQYSPWSSILAPRILGH